MDTERVKPLVVLLGVPMVLVAAVVVAIALWLGPSTTAATPWDTSSIVGAEVDLHYLSEPLGDRELVDGADR